MKKNLPIILAITIPILMIVFVAASIYIPQALSKPKYSFIYSVGDTNYGYGIHYKVTNGKIEQLNNPCPLSPDSSVKPVCPPQSQEPKLYIHDTVADTNKELSLSDAQRYNLRANTESLDGYRLEQGRRNNGIFEIFGGFDSNDYNTWYLKKSSVSKKVNLETGNVAPYYYYRNVQFLGWVI